MKFFTALLAGWTLLWQADRACAQGIIWNESVDGPLSNDGFNPTSLGVFGVGTNSIFAASERNGATTADDYFTFSIPSGTQVEAIILGTDLRILAWIGSPAFDELLGYSFTSQNGDLLSQFGLTEISAGMYGFNVANENLVSGFSVANYSLNFVVQPIPEPMTVSLFILGVGFTALMRKRR